MFCHQELVTDVATLECYHTFHEDCVKTYCDVAGVTIATMKCPVCKRTRDESIEANTTRMRELGLQSADLGIPSSWTDASGGARSVDDDETPLIDLIVDDVAGSAVAPSETASAPEGVSAELGNDLIGGAEGETAADANAAGEHAAGETAAEGENATGEIAADGDAEESVIEPESIDTNVKRDDEHLDDDASTCAPSLVQRSPGGGAGGDGVPTLEGVGGMNEGVQPTAGGKASLGLVIASIPAWNKTEDVVCVDCQTTCNPLTCRIVSKMEGKWRCPQCNSTFTKLYRKQGAGVASQLQEFTPAERTAFFKDAKSQTSSALSMSFVSMKKKYAREEKVYTHGGAFKPLSVWITMGYDGEALRTLSTPEDVMNDRVFGSVYRVPELTILDRGVLGQSAETSLATKPSKRARNGQPAIASVAEADGGATGEIDENGGSDSSSDSSDDSADSATDVVEQRARKLRKRAARRERKAAKRQKKNEQKEKDRLHHAELAAKLEAKADAKKAKDAMVAEKKAATLLQAATKKAEQACARALAKEDAIAAKQEAKDRAFYANIDKKLDVCISDIERTFRSAGADLVPPESKQHLTKLLKDVTRMKTVVGSFVAGLFVSMRTMYTQTCLGKCRTYTRNHV